MTDLQLSYVRSILKVVGAVLVAKGALAETDITSLQAIAEQLIGAGITAYALYKSHKVHA